jgi:hypothetical protein
MKITKLLHENREIVAIFEQFKSLQFVICPDCHQQKANPLLAQDTADLLFDSQLKSLLILCQQQEANSLLHT